MPVNALSRYARGPAGEIVIDITAGRVEDLYDDYDKRAPYIRRDLDPQLTEYLYECVREIGPEPFQIRITLEARPRRDEEARVRGSIPSYFQYMAELERREIRRANLRALAFVAVGLGLVVCSVGANIALATPPGAPRSVVGEILGEGLTIASWVAMWEGLAVLVADWFPRRRARRRYERLAAAPVLFGEEAPDARPAAGGR
jgi:hypothetical protein